MPNADPPRSIRVAELVEDYDVFLLDAYGVLVHAGGALPGAAAFIRRLRREGKRFFVVTNDASRLPETSARRYQSFGLEVEVEQVITSGSLLRPYFERARLEGARCMVLGPPDSVRYVEEAGGRVLDADADQRYEAFVVCDDAGYPFLDTLDTALSALYRHFDRGDAPHLVLPNPDLIYPRSEDLYGFTSGAVAMLLEAALARRYPERGLVFARLGKPHAPVFEEARRRAGAGRAVMIGDQLETDIAGARRAGIDAVLLGTGVTRWQDIGRELRPDERPTHLLDGLDET